MYERKKKQEKKQRVLSGVQEGSKTHRKNILVRINYKIGRKQNACKTEFKYYVVSNEREKKIEITEKNVTRNKDKKKRLKNSRE